MTRHPSQQQDDLDWQRYESELSGSDPLAYLLGVAILAAPWLVIVAVVRWVRS